MWRRARGARAFWFGFLDFNVGFVMSSVVVVVDLVLMLMLVD